MNLPLGIRPKSQLDVWKIRFELLLIQLSPKAKINLKFEILKLRPVDEIFEKKIDPAAERFHQV